MATATRAPFQCLPPFIYVVFCGTTDDVAAEEVFSPTSPSVSAIRGSTKVPWLRPPLVAFPRKSLSRCAHAWSRLRRGRYSSLPQVVATGTSRSSWKWHDGQRDPWRRTRAVQCTLAELREIESPELRISLMQALSNAWLLVALTSGALADAATGTASK